jgi:hypothetical protein
VLNKCTLANLLVIISALMSFSLAAKAQQFQSTEAQVPLIDLCIRLKVVAAAHPRIAG